jgi:hypothetical protein
LEEEEGGGFPHYSQVFLLSECDDLDIHIVKAGNRKLVAYPLSVVLKKKGGGEVVPV